MKVIKLKSSIIYCCVFLLTTITAWSQQFVAPITNIETADIYTITLKQDVLDHIGNNLHFIRIKNNHGIEAPYLLLPIKNQTDSGSLYYSFDDFSFIKKDTFSIVNFSYDGILEGFILKIANTTVRKSAQLEGSNDGENWYNILPNITLDNMTNNQELFSQVNINIPKSQYNNYRLIINDLHTAPIRVLDIGTIRNHSVEASRADILLDNISFQVQQSGKQTIIHVSRGGNTPITAIHISTNAPSRYNRNLFIRSKNSSNKRTEIFQGDITIDQKNNSFSLLSPITENEFEIVIENEDNPPLSITDCALYYKPITIAAAFEYNNSYQMYIDTTYLSPQYDLRLNDIMQSSLPQAIVGKMEVTLNNFSNEQDSKRSTYLMYILSAAGVGIVFYFGYRLLKDMQQEKNK